MSNPNEENKIKLLSAKSKWAEFRRANSSDLEIAKTIDKNFESIVPDWRRSINYERPLFVNGVHLGKIASLYNGFTEQNDVKKFFSDIILKDFKGTSNQKQQAMEFLGKAFHQDGLLRPVSAPLSQSFKNAKGEPVLTANNKSREGMINIQTTPQGFKVQEYCGFKTLIVLSNANEALKACADENTQIHPEKGKSSIIKAEATIAVDFSENASQPSLTIESNQMEITHATVAKYIDHRNLVQKIIDWFRNVFGLNDIKAIALKEPDKSIEARFKEDRLQSDHEEADHEGESHAIKL